MPYIEPYTEAGVIWTKPGVGTRVSTCTRCGSIVAEAQQDTHSDFHDGLAELWESQVN